MRNKKTFAKQQHREGPVPESMGITVKQFKQVVMDGVAIRTSYGDNCIKIGNEIVLVQNILFYEGLGYTM